ncbi:uncharacterized protein LOC106638532 isoform X2 [Copidosoma floridanum]|uniref:uncharacterized protein LOC106638532 isoform X2 n=1 Tax=Copidosoma floridanum TaxID=29053 RepID=UPI0006C95A1E|nr:uncharacterized protein LOC106638532 isoform X2 [Copidosoma floridanum]
MDPENIGKEAVLRVSNWLRGIWDMRRRGGAASPVQQWVDSLPSPIKHRSSDDCNLPTTPRPIAKQQSLSTETRAKDEDSRSFDSGDNKENHFTDMTVSTPIAVPSSSPAVSCPSATRSLARDPSFQSDSSHCSSVESLLESRRADPEAILMSLGFGGYSNTPQDGGPLARIPKRFLQPSKLDGIVIDDFVRHQQETNESLDSTSLGYRGLTGSPYVAPSEIVQKIMQRLREHESHEIDAYLQQNSSGCGSSDQSYLLPQQQDYSKLSVLSPDNRQFLDRPRSTSPDMRNKRMIIGQRSFAFGRDGDLIDLSSEEKYTEAENTMETTGPITTTEHKCLSDFKNNGDSTETVVPMKVNGNTNNNDDVHTSHEPSIGGGHHCREDEVSRRVSEGSNDDSLMSSFWEQEGRRHSDGVLQYRRCSSTESSTSRKRSLKRQAKIRETPGDDGIVPLEEESEDRRREKSRHSPCSHCGKLEIQDLEDESSDCHRRTIDKSCWREMEKVKEKNKQLEDTVAKSRKEISEIRDMLSTVLSVRMEPGF